MRILIAAVGRLKQGPERELAANYRKRAEAIGRSFGLREIEIVEIRESRAQDVERRRTEELIAIANIRRDGREYDAKSLLRNGFAEECSTNYHHKTATTFG